MPNADYCTCEKLQCPHHPTQPQNEGKGCTPCILKNLRQNEMPDCFFRVVEDDIAKVSDFSREGFAKLILEKEKGA